MHLRRLLACALIWSSAALSLADGRDDGWTVVEKERGITMSRREQPGLHLPAFRGQGRVKGDVREVFASMVEVPSVPLWAYGIDQARLIKRINERTDIIYLFSDIPWPVRDRDMIVRRTIEIVKPGEEFRINLSCEPKREPERDGIVRVKQCSSCFHLRRVDDSTTEIDYVMGLDPGGHLPSWVAGFVSETVPFKTLVAIEERAARTKGQHEALLRRFGSAM